MGTELTVVKTIMFSGSTDEISLLCDRINHTGRVYDLPRGRQFIVIPVGDKFKLSLRELGDVTWDDIYASLLNGYAW